ncbi:uncharacterized protein LOC121383927 [Gigantopelta aegis]|uniref:uncharacterized protein LOC121383927 n=1 Tax=Gigantopelta aegis TaxID=1735272 RepID=UPI001B88B51A|nr:uncharacterized protein LOC121383927 [Gigantopelta aegis]XP_041369959.1 uncharacterized protein LOC121383927 [Gigantopelta aegis]XP_041369960.1 uncharacterized protein LOC121383927 [Gigantopelta aegis]XP_041369962.1 uncharacterized protein LOC121383927 [Gigantopelta aegis]
MTYCRLYLHILFTIGVLVTGILGSKAEGIGCFVCTSINHNNPECEDTFNNTGKFFETDCWGSRKGRVGLFPGTQCIKMVAEDTDTGYSILIRNCVVDNGGTNPETEIGRMSHCGWMRSLKYMGKSMRGCIVSCDTDACNGAVTSHPTSYTVFLLAVICGWIMLHVAVPDMGDNTDSYLHVFS